MNTPIPWVLLASHVPPSLSGGGIVRYTVELARALAERDDVDLRMISSQAAAPEVAKLVGSKERVIIQPDLPGALTPSYERWIQGLFMQPFQVFQGVKHLIPAWARCHTVLTVHDMLLFDRGADYGLAKRHLLRRPYAASLRQADSLLCVSSATRESLLSRFPLTKSRISVVPSATSPNLLKNEPKPVQRLQDREFVLVVGDSSPRKNLATITRAWGDVLKEHPHAALVMVGPPSWGKSSYGPDYDRLTRDGHLIQLASVDDGTLRWLYERCAVVLAPSLAEGFGLPAVEALDLGAPLITSDDPALIEVSGPAIPHIRALDSAAWTQAICQRLRDGRPASTTARVPRTWSEVASDTVACVVRDKSHRHERRDNA